MISREERRVGLVRIGRRGRFDWMDSRWMDRRAVRSDGLLLEWNQEGGRWESKRERRKEAVLSDLRRKTRGRGRTSRPKRSVIFRFN